MGIYLDNAPLKKYLTNIAGAHSILYQCCRVLSVYYFSVDNVKLFFQIGLFVLHSLYFAYLLILNEKLLTQWFHCEIKCSPAAGSVATVLLKIIGIFFLFPESYSGTKSNQSLRKRLKAWRSWSTCE